MKTFHSLSWHTDCSFFPKSAPGRVSLNPSRLAALMRIRHSCSLAVAVSLVLLSWLSDIASAQVGTVGRNMNLRRDPSASQPSHTPPEELRLVSLNRVNKYYHVFTDANEEGWVWGPNVEVEPVSPAPVAATFPDPVRTELSASIVRPRRRHRSVS